MMPSRVSEVRFDSSSVHMVENKNARRSKQYRTRKALGIELYEPIKESADILQYFFDLGFSNQSMATALGVNHGTVHHWINREYPTITKTSARKIKALTVTKMFATAEPKSLVPFYPTRRRVSALRRMGWTYVEIESRLETLVDLRAKFDLDERIAAIVHREVAVLYEELWDKQGPSKQAAAIAKKLNLAPPAAWDNIDDPNDIDQSQIEEIPK